MTASVRVRVKATGTTLEGLVQEGRAMASQLETHFGQWSPKVSTSTCYVKVDRPIAYHTLHDFSLSAEWSRLKDDLGLDIMKVRVPGDKYKRGPRKPLKTFDNCVPITIKIPDNETPVCANMFRTGVNLTGVRNLEAFEVAWTCVFAIETTHHGKELGLTSWRMGMINAVMHLGRFIDIPPLTQRLMRKGYRCLYDRDKNAGLRIKWPPGGPVAPSSDDDQDDDDEQQQQQQRQQEAVGKWHTLIVFPSGKVTLAGMQHHDDVAAYVDVVRCILEL